MVINQRPLFWQIVPVTLIIILLTTILVAWYGSRSVNTFYLAELEKDLEDRAELIRLPVKRYLEAADFNGLRSFAVESGRLSNTRITVVDNDGRVRADTMENPDLMDNHRTRPEIVAAFDGQTGSSMRFSNTIGEQMLYVAVSLGPLHSSEPQQANDIPFVAVLRLAVPVYSIDTALGNINGKIAVGTVAALVVAFLITFLVAGNISKPLEEMTRSAEQYAEGNFSQRLLLNHRQSASREVARLASAMDMMADQLDEKINTISNQRNQLETVFTSMVEAVIAVDLDERIISLNAAAAKLFSVNRFGVSGRLVHEIIRNVALQEQFDRIVRTGESFEGETVLREQDNPVYLHTNVVSLYGGDGRTVGALMVLNDVTRLQKLERMRSDFVANVSHELKTPITSIRGYVETLLDGALEDREHAHRFLEIVLRQSEQLNTIIDDLLTLSRIEKDAEEDEIERSDHQLFPVLEQALELCRLKAEQKRVSLELDCPEDLSLLMNRTLIEQAVVNLLINGITYSDPETTVTVQAGQSNEQGQRRVTIRVIDHGIGIAKEHLPRLFERFYRSDRARSRKIGGTGLGLSIVKHIVQAHGGTVEVASTIGKGSVFTIDLPGN